MKPTITTILKNGGEYNETHVHALQTMCKTHAPNYNFQCLTDMKPNCPTIPLTQGWPGWWSKIEIFRLTEPTFYLDLDTIITNNIESLIQKTTHYNFTILRDWKPHHNRQNKTTTSRKLFNSALITFNTPQTHIYNTLKENPNHYMTEYKGDQEYIQDHFIEHQTTPITHNNYSYAYTNDLTKKIANYKHDTNDGKINDPNQHHIIIFQGHPRPWEQTTIPYPH